MVSLRLSAARRAARRGSVLAGALIALACHREGQQQETGTATTPDARVADVVRGKYRANDVEAAGAWVWTAPDGIRYVLVDAQSAVQGIVQARVDLWMASDTDAALFGRSEALPSAAEVGAYVFEDLSGDGVPDLFGYVSDSAGVSYPVFLPGSRPGMTEEIALAASGWRFSLDEEHTPQVYRDAGRACALQLWAEDPVPDNGAAGWRWLIVQPDGRLSVPAVAPPACGTGAGPGLQPGSPRP
jgi:hypothetical protein